MNIISCFLIDHNQILTGVSFDGIASASKIKNTKKVIKRTNYTTKKMIKFTANNYKKTCNKFKNSS